MEIATPESASPIFPALSAFSDYREYLRAFYNYKRKLHGRDRRPYTYAMFSAAADIKSPNYLKLIIEGQRNLSEDMISRFARALQLSKAETAEFRALVLFNQESDPQRRNQHLKELADLRVQAQLSEGKIDAHTWEKIPNWIYWVLQAMIDQRDVEFEPAKLQSLINRPVSLNEISAAVEKVLASGEVALDPETRKPRRLRHLIESPAAVPVALVRKLQAELLYIGLESLFRDEIRERESGALTLALTDEEFEQIRFELRQFRKRIHREYAAKRETSKGDRVYQLNIQFFSVTKSAPKC